MPDYFYRDGRPIVREDDETERPAQLIEVFVHRFQEQKPEKRTSAERPNPPRRSEVSRVSRGQLQLANAPVQKS